MEKIINKKLDIVQTEFKNAIIIKITDLGIQSKCPNESLILIDCINKYNKFLIMKEDLIKRKRVKNTITDCERCNAKRANGEQCSRRKKENELFCGTHLKGVPHGEIQFKNETKPTGLKKEVFVQEVKGIIYYFDYENNVYDISDIMAGVKDPKIIAQYTKSTDGEFHIPLFNL
jgi:hypothetical protein